MNVNAIPALMRIGDRAIGNGHPPLIIAEMSGNHNHSLDRAMEIVEAAAASGAHALKLQTYTADTLTLNVQKDDFMIRDEKSLWKGTSLYELYQQAYTPWEWHKPIMERARALGMLCFSSPFYESAVEFLEALDVPAYKIASFENTHLPLIRKAAATGKPLIISTGMATLAEIDEAVRGARDAGASEIVLLKCTSTYPASPENSNIATIAALRQSFPGCEAGLSDHTMGCGVAIAAVALGASVIEKHFTLRRADGGVDSAFSLEPEEFKTLCVESERAWRGLGRVTFGTSSAEEGARVFRRSLYISKDMQSGEVLTRENLRIVRPGFGLPPKFFETLLGRTVNRSVEAGTPLGWDLLGK
jgi:N-acetylneuraminate synthase